MSFHNKQRRSFTWVFIAGIIKFIKGLIEKFTGK
ncbi:TPA: alpha-1/alpha-2 family phenol-soluble modulin [Staphylococcus aureus]|nr:alpha-1/alpha-2 family phenol-soluble modulin [Staphylococcus aureus]